MKGKMWRKGKIYKRALAFGLATVLCLSSVELTAFAAEVENAIVTEENVMSEEDVAAIEVVEESTTVGETIAENEISTENTVQMEMSVGTVSGNDAEEAMVEQKITETATEEVTVEDQTTESVTEELEAVYEAENYRVLFNVSSYWEGAYNATITIENTGTEVIENWCLEFPFTQLISNIWNGEMARKENGDYVIKNLGWNQDIPVGGSVYFGFGVLGNVGEFPETYELVFTKMNTDSDTYNIQYEVLSDWGSGVNGQITLANTSGQSIEDWVLEFDYNRKIDQIWNAVIESHEDNHYVIRNAGYNANILADTTISFGFIGSNGVVEDEPANYVLYSYDMSDSSFVTFVAAAENVSNMPPKKVVDKGRYLSKPSNPVREGHLFMGWYTDAAYTEVFDFDNMVVDKDIILYARWLDYLCTVDTDGDGIVDSLEEYFGTDINNVDTDGDNISDYQEVYELGQNPLLWDTDGNGTDDYNDDLDGDGIVNGMELQYQTNASYRDTDMDDLSDYEEINTYFTNPALKDTDGDEAPDGWELANGYDPLVADDKFLLTASLGIINEANPVIAKVTLEAYEADVESLNISKVHSYDNQFISPWIAGYLGDAYDFTFDGKFDTAELTFEYDVKLGEIGEEFQPRIYYFNEETKAFEELENQIVENGRVTAVTTHFSTYILLNKVEFDKIWNTEIKAPADGEALNVAFVVDLSGSMYGTKLTTTKNAIYSFVDVLGENDKAALISFTNSATIRCNMTEDKKAIKDSVQGMVASGGTSIYKGIEKAINTFEDSENEGYKLMIVFTDGYDEPSTNYDTHYKKLVEQAKENDIIIYTIGISTIDEALLTKVAETTGGKYYYASNVSELPGKVDEIKKEATNYSEDSNGDGITDYHTQLIKEGKLVLSNSSIELKGIDFNYGEEGEEGGYSDDYDGDGIKNGDEIDVITENGRTYIVLNSHPLRVHSDGDGIDDYTEMQRGSNPLRFDVSKPHADYLFTDACYYFETTANNMRDDEFFKGLTAYSAIINGVWNKTELYREQLIEYYSTYVTQDVIDEIEVEKKKMLWYDVLTQMSSEYIKQPYDNTYNFNKIISYVNGLREADQFEADFEKRISDMLVAFNKNWVDGEAIRLEFSETPYIKKYWNSDTVQKMVTKYQNGLGKASNAISFLVYGEDILSTVQNLAIVEANKQVFNENVNALEWLYLESEDVKLRNAAFEVRDMIAGEYLDVYFSAIERDLFESGVDFAISSLASNFGYVAIVVAVRDLGKELLGSDEDIMQMYRILCYSDMCNVYSKKALLKLTENANGQYYSCYEVTSCQE